MKVSQLFFHTNRQPPQEAELASHQLLEQAGYIQRVSKGVYTYAPLMWKVLRKLCDIIRQELDAIGAQECKLPFLHPEALWHQTGRWDAYLQEKLLYTTKNREGHLFCLAPTCEELSIHMVSQWVDSYRQLPLILYQIGEKFRDEIRPRFGLMRAKEFLMHDAYAFATDMTQLQQQYHHMRKAYSAIFSRLGLKFVIVQAHGGKIGKGFSEEFQVLATHGEDAVLVAQDQGFNVEVARAIVPSFDYEQTLLEKKEVETVAISSIVDLSNYLKIPAQRILKTMLYKILKPEPYFVAIAIRGDREVNPVKVLDLCGGYEIMLASVEEIQALGSYEGFIGPGINLPLLADRSCAPMTNFVMACNKKDIHLCNVNWNRDLPMPACYDLALAQAGDQMEGSSAHFELYRGIEVAHIFELGTRYAEQMQACFQDAAGHKQPLYMGTFGIGVGRVAQACVEQLHDERGIVWPWEIAPFKIYIATATIQQEHMQVAHKLYTSLSQAGFEPLWDDRDARLGFKLKDSDLLGIPYKIIIGKSWDQTKKLEIESRVTMEKQYIAIEDLIDWLQQQHPSK